MKKVYLSYTALIHHYKSSYPRAYFWSLSLLISWLYGVCEQIAIPIPFNPVPLIVQQILLFCLPRFVGWAAFSGYSLFLVQGALGAPFFAHGGSGITYLMGPTGGYLLGMGLASLWLVVTNTKEASWWHEALLLEVANGIIFACGLAYLSLFVPSTKLLALGLFPFMIGDCIIKPGIVMVLRKLGGRKELS
jgi:biotin transport system substrate-specific component